MKKLNFNQLNTSQYFGIITILDYEIRTSSLLKDLSFPPSEYDLSKKVLVDMALKTGMNQYRFIEFSVDSSGKIQSGSNKYVIPTFDVELEANSILQGNREIVLNSMLPEFKKEELCTKV